MTNHSSRRTAPADSTSAAASASAPGSGRRTVRVVRRFGSSGAASGAGGGAGAASGSGAGAQKSQSAGSAKAQPQGQKSAQQNSAQGGGAAGANANANANTSANAKSKQKAKAKPKSNAKPKSKPKPQPKAKAKGKGKGKAKAQGAAAAQGQKPAPKRSTTRANQVKKTRKALRAQQHNQQHNQHQAAAPTPPIVPQRRRTPPVQLPIDPLLDKVAIDLARAVVAEADADAAGEYLGVSRLSPETVVHRFASALVGYSGWEWGVSISAVPGTDHLTVNEVFHRAGDTATLAPEWVPYEDRIQPGDLGPGDTLPPRTNDERLSDWDSFRAGPTLSDADIASARSAADAAAHPTPRDTAPDSLRSALPEATTGFPRNHQAARALTRTGVAEALQRWREGDFGPRSPHATQAAFSCRSCAFFLPWGPLAPGLGVCTNEFSADGRVVQFDYGCGAHSDTREDSHPTGAAFDAYDDGGYVVIPDEPQGDN